MATTSWQGRTARPVRVKRYEDGILAFASSTTSSVLISGEKTGTNNLSWRLQVARGQNATTNFSAEERLLYNVKIHGELIVPKQTSAQQTLHHIYDGGTNSLSDPPTTSSIPASVVSAAETLAREQFLRKYRQTRTAFQSGVFLGELMKTVRMISSPAKSLRSAINDYRRSLKKRGRMSRPDYRRYIADSWLEWSFGVRPLVRDVEDACRIACASPSRYSEPISALGVMEFKDSVSNVRSAPSIGYPTWVEKTSQKKTVWVRYKGAAAATMGIPSFPEQLGLSWSNVLPTVWELIPGSFLVDYFTNVGTVIEGISTGVVQLAWGVKTVRKTSASTLVECAMHPSQYDNFGTRKPYGFVNGSGYIGHSKTVSRSRVDAVGLSILDLRFRLPGPTSLKWLNIAGLAAMRA